ncbi:MAG: hypothetical protein L0H53_17205 [Candidatus Nitrosocosmicus sp.]|nr:hypothetical protein [Candidatus Nitrosocosmicus sp.]
MSPEIMMREVWNIVKQDSRIMKYYPSFEDFQERYLAITEQKELILIWGTIC